MKNLKSKSLSELSFEVLTNPINSEQLKAKKEILRRFNGTPYSYKAFMEYEEMALEKRGKDISAYLISNQADIKLFMEIYFNYVCNQPIREYGNLLFSELMLCNNTGYSGFMKKILTSEIDRLEQIAKNNLDNKNAIALEELKKRLSSLNMMKYKISEENTITDALYNIMCNGPYSFYNPNMVPEGFEDIDTSSKKNMVYVILVYILLFPGQMLSMNDFFENGHLKLFGYKDFIKLNKQKNNILKSLKESEIDYSFIDEQKLILKK